MLNPDRYVEGLIDLLYNEIAREKFDISKSKTLDELNMQLHLSVSIRTSLEALASTINKREYDRFIIKIPTLNRNIKIVIDPIVEEPVIIYLIEMKSSLTSYVIYQIDEVNNAKIKINKI